MLAVRAHAGRAAGRRFKGGEVDERRVGELCEGLLSCLLLLLLSWRKCVVLLLLLLLLL